MEKEREPACAGSLLFLPRTKWVLLAQAARDVAEDVLDLVAEDDQDYDHDHRDQDEDKGVLDHTLPFLTVEQSAKLEIKVGQHASFTSLWRDRTGPSFTLARVQINECRAEERRRTFYEPVTANSRLTNGVTTRSPARSRSAGGGR